MSLYDRVVHEWGETNPQGVSKLTHKNLGWIAMPLRRKLRTGEVVDPTKFVTEAKKPRLTKAQRRALDYYAKLDKPDPVINFPWRADTLQYLVPMGLLQVHEHPVYYAKRKYSITDAGRAALEEQQSPAKVPGSGWITLHYPAGTRLAGKADVVVGGGQNKDEVDRIKRALQWIYPGKRVGDLRRGR